MDTKTVAQVLGTTPSALRRFLRSDASTFQAVGSGARYDFTDRDMVSLSNRFNQWKGLQPVKATPPVVVPDHVSNADAQTIRDQEVWDGEPSIILEDLSNPRVLAKVRRIAREQEQRLDEMLMAVGLHISQMERMS